MPFLFEDSQEMTQEQAKLFAEQADFENPLVAFKDRGYRLELLGKEDMEGKPAFKLKLTKTDGTEIFFYIDADSGLDLKSTLTTRTGETEILNEILYGDFKPVDGVMMPFSVENRMNGKSQMRMTMETIEINPVIDEALFTMPQIKEAAKTDEQK
jgi:hypothetical protein